ncbi:hypothetical protein MTBPR1_70063 [Candidatus Terasakiella magnetica]|uniref:EAL domain-containing protein n=1 Tax=Candidatus Terasakiella magnetica TaxID=1867952 RepID=A0A1C3RKP4_9PROT|nr:hypothetical protein [Candidatus Terasakiella magnetica]SCA57791.1 hypothetical protein MTBPR1_70063 [Candidatus Terasakiella magnetica]
MFKWVKKAKKLFSGQTSGSSLVHIDDDGFMAENISVSIEDVINQDENEDLGKLHILSLTEFHQALGDTWDAREAKIQMLTENLLRERIGEGNRWEHQSREIYIMLFPALSEIEGTARAFEISEELGFKIIGERFDGGRRPLVRVAGVDPKDALNEDGTLNIAKLEEVGREGEAAGDPAPIKDLDAKQDDQDDDSPDWKKKKWEHEEAETDWQKDAHENVEANTDWKKQQLDNDPEASQDWQKNKAPETGKEADADPQWKSISAQEEPVKQKQTKPKAKPKYTARFQPCWEKTQESLCIYRSILCFDTAEGRHLEGVPAYAGYRTPKDCLKVDLWLLQETAKALFPMISKKVITPVFLPIHSTSLRQEQLEDFLAGLTKYTENLRQNYLVLEIMDDGKWEEAPLQDLCEQLSPQVHALAFRPIGSNGFKAPLCKEFSWIGVDFQSMSEETAITAEQVSALHKHAASIQAKLYSFSINKREQLGEMIDLGSTLLGGIALVKTTDKLRAPFNLPIERLKK